MKFALTYTYVLRKSGNIQVIMGYKKLDSKFASKISLAKSYLDDGNVRYETKANILWLLYFNYAMFIKSEKLANKILDKLLLKAIDLYKDYDDFVEL